MSIFSTLVNAAKRFGSAFGSGFWSAVRAFMPLWYDATDSAMNVAESEIKSLQSTIDDMFNSGDFDPLTNRAQDIVNGVVSDIETVITALSSIEQSLTQMYSAGMLRDCVRQGVLTTKTTQVLGGFLDETGIKPTLDSIMKSTLGVSMSSSGSDRDDKGVNWSAAVKFTGYAGAGIVGFSAGGGVAAGEHKSKPDSCVYAYGDVNTVQAGLGAAIGVGGSNLAPHHMGGIYLAVTIGVAVEQVGGGVSLIFGLTSDFSSAHLTGITIFYEGGAQCSLSGGIGYAVIGAELDGNGVHILPEELEADTDFTPVDGALYKPKNDATIYQIVSGCRRWIPDPTTFDAMGLEWGSVQELESSKIHGIPKNLAYPSRTDDTLLMGSDGTFYLMQGGYKCAFQSMESLTAWGYQPFDALFVLDDDLEAIPTGQDLPVSPG